MDGSKQQAVSSSSVRSKQVCKLGKHGSRAAQAFLSDVHTQRVTNNLRNQTWSPSSTVEEVDVA